MIRCRDCGKIIEGDKRGTYIKCECGKVAIDETEYYCRIIGNDGDYEIVENINVSDTFTRKLLNNLELCDSLHNNCDYLLDHSDIDLLLDYIKRLENAINTTIDSCSECVYSNWDEDEYYSGAYDQAQSVIRKLNGVIIHKNADKDLE